jgi:regulator of replication initiation timing
MTESLLEKLEEKMMLLLAELEDAHKEIHHLVQENDQLKQEKERNSKKLADILSLLESTHAVDDRVSHHLAHVSAKPMLVQA